MPYRINPFTGELDRVLSPGGGTASIEFATDSGVANPTVGGVITFTGGAGILTAGAGSTVTITSTSGFTWIEVTSTTQDMDVQTGYVANNASLITLTLPGLPVLGDIVKVVGKGLGLYKIAQKAGQTVHFINVDTTTGVGGSLTAIERYAAIELVCITQNDEWVVVDSSGNFTVI